MNKDSWIRVSLFFALLVVSYTLPWWISVILALAVLFQFGFVEVIAIGVILDSLYGNTLLFGFHFGFFYTAIFMLVILARPGLRAYFFPGM